MSGIKTVVRLHDEYYTAIKNKEILPFFFIKDSTYFFRNIFDNPICLYFSCKDFYFFKH